MTKKPTLVNNSPGRHSTLAIVALVVGQPCWSNNHSVIEMMLIPLCVPQRHLNPDTSFSCVLCARNAVNVGGCGIEKLVKSKGWNVSV